MEPHDPLQPHAGEAAMSLEAGLVVLGIGVLIFVYLIFKLVREYRERKARRDPESE